MTVINSANQVPTSDRDVFWGEIAPCEHLAHIYDDDSEFLASLESFVTDGWQRGESVVLIITPEHRDKLENRLSSRDPDIIATARANSQYIVADAAKVLSEFMKDGWPDEERFNRSVARLLRKARRGGRRVRAFGEMVALLWASGQNGATVRLEYLWSNLCKTEMFPLYCAYPKSGFTQEAAASLHEICAIHSKMLGTKMKNPRRETNEPG